LDANVIAALQALTGEQWINGWRVNYVRYLYRAADWAAQWDTTGDVIERGLREKGSTLLNTRPRVSRNWQRLPSTDAILISDAAEI
jgi:hypothetical protein